MSAPRAPSPCRNPLRIRRYRIGLGALCMSVGLCLGALLTPVGAFAEANDRAPAVHRIYQGQTLGMIAKRYRISVDALCHANGISPNARIRPGDQLVIPARSDKDGSAARGERDALLAGKAPKSGASSKAATPTKAATAKTPSAKAPPSKARSGLDALQKHTVYSGQTLGMIAKRYRVSVEALCNANGITPSSPIRPGDELIVPSTEDRDGSAARKLRGAVAESAAPAPEAEPARSNPEPAARPTSAAKRRNQPQLHVVVAGDSLSALASRYDCSVEALGRANGMRPSAPLFVGRELVIPASDDTDGGRARTWWKARAQDPKKESSGDWRSYKKPAWRRGYITLESPNGKRRWKGYVIGPNEQLLPLAREKVTDVLASWRTGKTKTIDRRLVQLIARVSDVFGGRTIRVVSGYREHSHSSKSKHPQGKALDFSVHGVPNWAVRDYLRTLPNVGVGYYPNSSFVHLDVREEATYWVDASEPGEAPRYVHREKGRRKGARR